MSGGGGEFGSAAASRPPPPETALACFDVRAAVCDDALRVALYWSVCVCVCVCTAYFVLSCLSRSLF